MPGTVSKDTRPGRGGTRRGAPKVGEPPAYLRTAPGRGMFRSPVVRRRRRGFQRRPPRAALLPRLPAAAIPTLPAWGMFPVRPPRSTYPDSRLAYPDGRVAYSGGRLTGRP